MGQSPEKLSDDIVADLQDVVIMWCSDGTAVISVDGKTDAEIESVIGAQGVELKATCRQDIKHRLDRATGKERVHERLERTVKAVKKTVVE